MFDDIFFHTQSFNLDAGTIDASCLYDLYFLYLVWEVLLSLIHRTCSLIWSHKFFPSGISSPNPFGNGVKRGSTFIPSPEEHISRPHVSRGSFLGCFASSPSPCSVSSSIFGIVLSLSALRHGPIRLFLPPFSPRPSISFLLSLQKPLFWWRLSKRSLLYECRGREAGEVAMSCLPYSFKASNIWAKKF